MVQLRWFSSHRIKRARLHSVGWSWISAAVRNRNRPSDPTAFNDISNPNPNPSLRPSTLITVFFPLSPFPFLLSNPSYAIETAISIICKKPRHKLRVERPPPTSVKQGFAIHWLAFLGLDVILCISLSGFAIYTSIIIMEDMIRG